MISSRNEHASIPDLSDLTLQIIINAWWAVMSIGSKCPFTWNYFRCAPSCQFHLHCKYEETSRPSIICLICHQHLHHPSHHGIYSMGKLLLAKSHIAKINTLSESEGIELTSSMVDEMVLAIMKKPGSSGSAIQRSQRKFISDIQVWSILTKVIGKTLQSGS